MLPRPPLRPGRNAHSLFAKLVLNQRLPQLEAPGVPPTGALFVGHAATATTDAPPAAQPSHGLPPNPPESVTWIHKKKRPGPEPREGFGQDRPAQVALGELAIGR